MIDDRHPDTTDPEDEGLPEMEGPPPRQRLTSDAPEGMVIPGDEPRAAEDHGTTAAEQREGRSIGERLAEEEPDRSVSAPEREQAGRLVEEGRGLIDTEDDLVADEAEGDRSGLTAEEAAMRIEDGAPGATSHPDDYVEDE